MYLHDLQPKQAHPFTQSNLLSLCLLFLYGVGFVMCNRWPCSLVLHRGTSDWSWITAWTTEGTAVSTVAVVTASADATMSPWAASTLTHTTTKVDVSSVKLLCPAIGGLPVCLGESDWPVRCLHSPMLQFLMVLCSSSCCTIAKHLSHSYYSISKSVNWLSVCLKSLRELGSWRLHFRRHHIWMFNLPFNLACILFVCHLCAEEQFHIFQSCQV